MIDKSITRAFRVRRRDGAIVTLTCSLAEWEQHWSTVYEMKSDLSQFEEEVVEQEAIEVPATITTAPAKSRRRSKE